MDRRNFLKLMAVVPVAPMAIAAKPVPKLPNQAEEWAKVRYDTGRYGTACWYSGPSGLITHVPLSKALKHFRG